MQKKQHVKGTKPPIYKVGSRVVVYMPGARPVKACKFSRPFYGPYWVVGMSKTGVTVQSADQTEAETIQVAYARVHHCPEPTADTFWPTKARNKNKVVAPMGGHDCHSVKTNHLGHFCLLAAVFSGCTFAQLLVGGICVIIELVTKWWWIAFLTAGGLYYAIAISKVCCKSSDCKLQSAFEFKNVLGIFYATNLC